MKNPLALAIASCSIPVVLVPLIYFFDDFLGIRMLSDAVTLVWLCIGLPLQIILTCRAFFLTYSSRVSKQKSMVAEKPMSPALRRRAKLVSWLSLFLIFAPFIVGTITSRMG